MNTFLPYPSFYKSAEVLDIKRLGKQRVEVLQILNTLSGKTSGWKHHPAVKMWKGYENTLIRYGLAICDKWVSLGYKDTCRRKIYMFNFKLPLRVGQLHWLGNEDFHLSHKSNLLRKDPEHYGKFWDVPNNLPYVWPSGNPLYRDFTYKELK